MKLSAVQCSAVLCYEVQCSAVQCTSMQCSAAVQGTGNMRVELGDLLEVSMAIDIPGP